jgi:hypothetical protein
MTLQQFIHKWKKADLSERSAASQKRMASQERKRLEDFSPVACAPGADSGRAESQGMR